MLIKEPFRTDGNGRVIFMSDLHYGHANILNMTKRPFNNIEDMNKNIAETLATLTPDDILFDLGDMFWKGDIDTIDNILTCCFAKKYKIMGNHDKNGLYRQNNAPLNKHFELVADFLEIKVNYQGTDYRCFLSHYPMLAWNHKSIGSINVVGHSHGNLDEFNDSVPDLRFDVGVDGKLATEKGSWLIEFKDIYEATMKKTGGLSPQEWVWSNCKRNEF